MGSFGEKLRREREMRAITLEEIAAATKIGTRSLKALEEEQFDQLPGGIFNKGFVRSYAKYLGLDEDQAVTDYLAAAGEETPEQKMDTMSVQLEAARQRELAEQASARTNMVPIIVAVVVVAVLLAAGVAYRWVKTEGAHLPAWANLKALHRQEVTPPQQAPTPEPANSAASTPQVPPSTAPDTTTPEANTNAAPTPDASQSEWPVNIALKATTRVWVSVRADGKMLAQETLDPNQETTSSRSFHAKQKLTLMVGNPAGLEVTYNGKVLGKLGAEGQRKSVTFTPEGVTLQ